MKLVPRDQWDARAPRSRQLLATTQLYGMVVHYSGAAREKKDNHDECAGVVRSIQAYHMDSNGWADIAYNFLPCSHGYVFEGRGWDIRSAAQGTNEGNEHYLAACFIGGDVEGRDDVTQAGRDAIRELVQLCDNRYVFGNNLKVHSDFRPTACPGNELRSWIKAGMPVDPSTPLPENKPEIRVSAPPVCLLPHPQGYWIVTADGGVFTFGNAPFFGSTGGQKLNSPIVDAGVTRDFGGYWLAASDGGIFSFGNAEFEGSLGDIKLNRPIVSFAGSVDGKGYWMLGEDGGLFGLGPVPHLGRVYYEG